MNIISNNCIGGFLYKFNNLKYGNPFIWHQLNSRDFVKLIKDYNSIDFYDYDIECNKNRKDRKHHILESDLNCFHIILSNGISIYYNHYKYDCHALTPIKRGVDVFYYRNYELTYNKYKERVSRMNEPPVFVYFYKAPENDDLLDVNKMISYSSMNNYKLVLIVDSDLTITNKNVLYIQEHHLTPVDDVARKYSNVIMPFLNQ